MVLFNPFNLAVTLLDPRVITLAPSDNLSKNKFYEYSTVKDYDGALKTEFLSNIAIILPIQVY